MTTDPKLLAAQAQELKARGRLGDAIALYRQAVAAAPGSAAAAHNLAAALGDAGLWGEAETHIRTALATGAGAAESWLVLGRCLQSRGAFDDAEAAFLEAVQRRPTMQDALLDLAQLRWMRSGDIAAATSSVDAALRHSPANLGVRLVRIKILENTGHAEAAFEEAQRLAQTHPDDFAIAVVASQLAADQGHSGVALAHAERATTLVPQHPIAAVALITACLGVGDASRAEVIATEYLRNAPHDQHALALLATAWRMLDDPRYHAIYDYDTMVRTFFLDVPPGWTSLAGYVGDLRAALQRAHRLQTHPFNQSIRHGSQTSDILNLDDPAIAALPLALDGPITEFLASLGPGDAPLRRRHQGGYAFQGMWSIRMQAGGYHVDHVHPNGWISSACYVEAPEGLSGHDGWLRFGAPGVRTEPELAAERFIEPQAGMVVLFPSYMWHGVIPFTAPGARMSFAFDLEPAAAPPRR
jgi:tetratricopeptide (TPR) repeat protein